MSVNEKMTALANAIRAKTGNTKAMTLDQMAQAVAGIADDGSTLTAAEILILSDPEAGLYAETNGSGVQFAAYAPEGTGQVVVDETTQIITKVPSAQLGDAKASDVRAGKTFTSASGVKLTGTMEV